MNTESLPATTPLSQYKRLLRLPLEWLFFTFGLAYYAIFRSTLPRAWQSTVYLFCHTGGKSLNVAHAVIKAFHRPKPVVPSGILGELTEADIARIVKEVDQKGYYVCEKRLPAELCDELLRFSLNQEYGWMNDTRVHGVRFHRARPEAIKYQVAESDVINNPTVQKIMGDRSFLSIAQSYLDCSPITDMIGLWWTTAFSQEANPRAATMYHFDLSRIRWLNVFINITDVDAQSGPHTFVDGTHRPGGIPGHLLHRGYVRLTDKEVASWYGEDRIKEFSGPKGTIIIEDTRGLHKGKAVQKGDRLLFQISYVNSLFGGQPEKAEFKAVLDPELEQLCRDHPRLFARYL